MEAETRTNKKKQERREGKTSLKQVRGQSGKLAQDLHELSKPTKLSAEDEHLNKYIRAQICDGDPMAQYISEKALKNNPPAWPVYQAPACVPILFGIPPGYR